MMDPRHGARGQGDDYSYERCQVEGRHLVHPWINLDAEDEPRLICLGDGPSEPLPVSNEEITLALSALDLSTQEREWAAQRLAEVGDDGGRRYYTEPEVRRLFRQSRKHVTTCSWPGAFLSGIGFYTRPVGMALLPPWPRVGETITFVDYADGDMCTGLVAWAGWGSRGHAVRVRGSSRTHSISHIIDPNADRLEVAAKVEALAQARLRRDAAFALRQERHRVAAEHRALVLAALPTWLRKGRRITWTDAEAAPVDDARQTLRDALGIHNGTHEAVIHRVRVGYRFEVEVTVEERQLDNLPLISGGPGEPKTVGPYFHDVRRDVRLHEMRDITPFPRSKAEAKRWAETPPEPIPDTLPTLPTDFLDD